jgi:ATP-binding protein involved in chromosome partitioning
LTNDQPAARQAPPRLGTPVQTPAPKVLADVRHVVAIASGKGGVGKSTTAVNLALGLRANGLKVGILDADIHGPSIPTLLALHGQPRMGKDRRLLPMQSNGLSAMSMGMMVDAETAMVWRGPMVMSAITQMLAEVDWGVLDVLIVDMPPGTGDAQLAIAQGTTLSGAVIVSTPQDLALIDARRGIAMFRKVDVPILGVIENMAHFTCTECGTQHALFGTGGAQAEALRLGVPFLGAVPLTMDLRMASDSGHPVVARDPDGPLGRLYIDMATNIWSRLTAPLPDNRTHKNPKELQS